MIFTVSSLHCPFKPTNLVLMRWRPQTPTSARPPHALSTPLQSPETGQPRSKSTKHTTFLVETFHKTQTLKSLLRKIQHKDSDPLHILRQEGDWTKEQFWAVMRFLHETSRMDQALQVFDFWKGIEESRINEVNYTKVIDLLGKSGMIDNAMSVFQEMKMIGFTPSVEICNLIIHGFAKKGEFDNACHALENMVESNVRPELATYEGLIQAYGYHRMYDEMCRCLKKMEAEGFSPAQVTYNILIKAFAQGGLLDKMEGVHRTLLSKKMVLQSSTLVAMLEAYANFGIVEKMDKAYRRILNSNVCLKEELIRKMARIYLENYMFSRLEELGRETASKFGKTNYLVWCLLLLSSACLMSHKGMESVIQEMKRANVKPHVTYTNIIALAYMRMKDFKHLDIVLCQLRAWNVKPDIITLGVAFDAYVSGSERIEALDVWRRIGFLKEEVEMNTDPLVFNAFGKGSFVRNCENLYMSLGSKGREKKVWTYNDLIDLVFGQNRRKPVYQSINQQLRFCRT